MSLLLALYIAPVTTVTISQNTGATYTGFQATGLESANPTVNYNDTTFDNKFQATAFTGGQNANALFKATGLSNIAASETATSAKVRLSVVRNGTAPTYSVSLYRVLRNDDITQATFNVFSTGNNWQTAGGVGALDIASTPSATATISQISGGVLEFSGAQLTQDVNDMIDGVVPNYGWLAIATNYTTYGDENYIHFNNNANGVDGTRPALVVELAASGGVTGTATTSQAQTVTATGSHAPLAVTGVISTSQAQATVVSGAFSAGVTGVLNSSQTQTIVVSGLHTAANVLGNSATNQAQSAAANGSYTVAAITGIATSSQAQTIAANGVFATGISGIGATSQTQTSSAAGAHAVANVTGNVLSAQAQTSVVSGLHTVAGVTGNTISSQAQVITATGSQVLGVNGVVGSSQAQTIVVSGNFSIQPVSGVATTSQAQTISANNGVNTYIAIGGIDLFEAQRKNRRKPKEKPDNELTEQEAEIKALMQVVISKKTTKSRKAAKLFAIQPLELPKTGIKPKVAKKTKIKQDIQPLITDDEIEMLLSLMLEMM
jgi:hypothetical protein